MSKFALGTLLTRGAGCTINDIHDAELDAQVDRCKSRPIPSGMVSQEQAQLWFATQILAAFTILLTLPPVAIQIGFAAAPLIMAYPLAKR